MAVWVSFNDLNCRKCNTQLKKVRGCIDEVPVRIIEGIEVNRCPLTYLTFADLDRLQMFKTYKDGYLPNAGGWLEQPMKYAQVINFIDNEVTRLEEQKNG